MSSLARMLACSIPLTASAVLDAQVSAYSLAAIPAGESPDVELVEGPRAGQAVDTSRSDVSTTSARDVRVNEFVSSSQDAAAIAATPDGGCVVTWESRRQSKMAYGVYAQCFDSSGAKLGGEQRVQLFEGGAQTHPSVAISADGALWFAWESFGQDGEFGGIVARRFESGLTRGGDEIAVNTSTAGHQSECSVAAGAQDDALVAWTGVDSDGGRSVFVRRLAPDMSRASEERRLVGPVVEKGARATLPCVVRDPRGGWFVAWCQSDARGVPRSVLACELDETGAPRTTPVVLDLGEFGGAVEVAIALSAERMLALGAFAPRDAGYAPFVQRFEWDSDATSWTRLSSVLLPGLGNGAPSGLDLTYAADGRIACVWSNDVGADAGFDTQLSWVEPDGSAGEPLPATYARAGAQRLSVGASGRRVAVLRDGTLALVWNGDAQLGDATGVHLSMLRAVSEAAVDHGVGEPLAAGSGSDRRSEPPFAALESEDSIVTSLERAERSGLDAETSAVVRVAAESDGASGPDNPTAQPHDPPIRVGPPPATSSLAPSMSGPDFGFAGLSEISLSPPDPMIAVGPNHVVQVVNDAVAWFTKAGVLQSSQSYAQFFQTAGFLFDAEVIFDPHSQRFMALVCNRAGSSGLFHLAVSDDDDPNGAWARYTFDVTALAASASIDSPNLGVDAQAVYLTADFPPFTAGEFLIFTIDKAPLLVGAPNPATRSLRVTTSQSWGTPVMQSAAPAYYFVEGLESPNPTQIRLHALTDPLGAPTLTTFSLTVPAYTPPADPPQLGTTVRPETFEARFWSCVFINGRLYATHHQGAPRVRQRWYEIDMGNWPLSGAPSLRQSGDVDLGPGVHTFFGSIAADALGRISLTYARSSATELISLARSVRSAGDPLGVLRPSVLLHASSAPTLDFRWGDYSACVTDPASPGLFWGAGQHQESGWETWIASWDSCGAPLVYCTTSTTTNGCAPSLSANGVPSALAPNGFTLVCSNVEGARNGLIYFGPNPTQVAWSIGSSSVKCVALPSVRMSVQFSGGVAGACNGTLIEDWNAWRAANPFALGSPFVEGQTLHAQAWFRDPPAPRQSNLSDAIAFTLCP